MAVPLGNWREAPSIAFQVPAVNASPTSWLMPNVALSEMSPESASMMPVFVIEPKTLKEDSEETPVVGVLRMVPALFREVCPGAEPESEISVRPPSPSRR